MSELQGCAFCGRAPQKGVTIICGDAAGICGPCVDAIRQLFDEERVAAEAVPRNRMQRAVQEFMIAMEQTVGTAPGIRDAELRSSLIAEEARETVRAIGAGDLVGAVDGLCDLLYVVFGTAVAFGVDLQEFFDLVQSSNMRKLGPGGRPIKDALGKVRKPAGWQPPDIAGLLARRTAEAARRPS